MRVLVLGGGGLLGKYLLPKLSRDNDVAVGDKLLGHMQYNLPKGTVLYTSDVTDLNSTRQAFRKFKPEVVVLSVAHHYNKDILYSQFDDVGLVYRSANVVSELITSQVRQVVFCSSSEVYGGPQTTKPVSETRKINLPSTQHGAAKLSAESLLQLRCNELGVTLTTLRIFDMYGPRDFFCPRTGMVNFLVDTFQEGKQTAGLAGAKRGKDFVHASDVATAITYMVDNNISGMFNVGTGKRTTLIGLVKVLAGIMDIKIPPMLVPDGKVTSFSAVADTRRISACMPNWNPKLLSADTLQDIVNMRTVTGTSNKDLLAEFKRNRGI